ncbi:uracil-DNA glycosylase family protein [Haloarcula argentinensis]|uniref:Uracil-DNA glycosylase family protein n=1 Tax=Haloarcula argentinensis TaxID=43776 RepID=A0ABU2F5S5_HALAR|nr:uracil-DNA glycosylase family protein [Haloarcula argentinensis]MDS0255929.1 uracil-DNA glycosylase family protein [Haloarcula argentinensis]
MENRGTDIVERIAADFTEGNGPCMSCPKRDDDCYALPFYGYGKSDAEVVIVAESPGGTETVDKTDEHLHKDRKRRWKNYRETGVEHERDVYESQIQSIGNLPIDAGGLPERLAEDFSVYFTNSVKCSDIHHSQTISDEHRRLLNEYGKRRCLSHLDKELKFIEPDAVVVLGNSKSKDNLNHLETMFDFFELSSEGPSGGTIKDYVHNSEYQSGQSPFSIYFSDNYDCHVIPSYHFTRGYNTYSEYTYGESNEDSSSNEKYCDEMANVLSVAIDS